MVIYIEIYIHMYINFCPKDKVLFNRIVEKKYKASGVFQNLNIPNNNTYTNTFKNLKKWNKTTLK